MLWFKALHIIFMVTWFAGLFYLPRLFVYHADCKDETGHQRFLIMERKLFAIMTIGAVLTAIFGFWMLGAYAWDAYSQTGWLPVKLVLVALLVTYHVACLKVMRDFRNGTNRHSHVYYRWFNEAPALLLIAIVLLAVAKPF
ncbi:MAG: protoporphyrinogen oxidase HemJ [Pseudomonadota bacterium]